MDHVHSVVLAARLLTACVVVLLLPGLAWSSALRVTAAWPERLLLGFAVSYSWIFVLSAAIPLLGWTADHAAVLTLLMIGIPGAVALRRARSPDRQPARTRESRAARVVVGAMVVAVAVGGWLIEPPITGEEALDLASLSRFADGGPITFENTSLLPDTRPVYLFQPYQLALGMISRWSATDPLVTLVKFRAFLVPLCAVFVYVLLRQFAPTPIEAVAVAAVMLLFVVIDFRTWEDNSLVPFVRRGGFTAGILVPALLALCLAATRGVVDDQSRRFQRLALAVTPVMVVAALATHALEVFTVLCFAAAVTTLILIGGDRSGDRRHAVMLMALLAGAAASYVVIQSRGVPYVTAYERGSETALRAQLSVYSSNLPEAIGGEVPEGARNLLSQKVPATIAGVVGIPALAFAALRVPVAAAIISAGLVPLALALTLPAGYSALALVASEATLPDVNAYFALLGLIGLALGLVSLTQALLWIPLRRAARFRHVLMASAIGSLVLYVAWTAEHEAVRRLIAAAVERPRRLLLIESAGAAAIVWWARVQRRPPLEPLPFSIGVVALSLCLAIPIALPNTLGAASARDDRVNLFARLQAAIAAPSVTDWPAYYESMRDTIAPPLPVPRTVIDDLRRRVPPRQVLLANPQYSCALVVLIDAYCINPERIYGHYFLTAAPYLEKYVVPGQPPIHPFFNSSPLLSDAERRLLTEYHVSYILADPEHGDAIGDKLRQGGVSAALEADREGYRLYRINGT